MQATLEELEKEAMQLPEDQKISLAHKILQSTEPPEDPAANALWEAEIIRRIEKLDKGKTELHDASEVFAELDKQLQK
ncbi:MAG: addiction module protein [Verrucomicrobia bacterium]|nr:addiction module protein [Verrucomicrobiota bacterium]